MARGKNKVDYKESSGSAVTSGNTRNQAELVRAISPTASQPFCSLERMDKETRTQEAIAFARAAVHALETAADGTFDQDLCLKHAKKLLKRAMKFLKAN